MGSVIRGSAPEIDSERGRRADIQGLRAIAVLLVVAYHAGLPLRGGFVGVDVFFVISGFVIARLLLRELSATSHLDLAAFYARRVRRLLPALAVLLIVVTVTGAVLLNPLGPQQATARTSIGATLFSANLELFRTPTGYFDLGAETNALLHTWSLSVEEQFYFVFPFSLLIAWRLGRKLRGGRSPHSVVTALVVAATVSSFVLSWYTSRGYGDRIAHSLGGSIAKLAFYLPATRVWEFGVGILVALVPSAVGRPRRLAGLLGVAGLALVGAGAWMISDTDPFPGTVALLPVLGTALVIVAGSRGGTAITSWLAARPMVWIGDVSYGWYLWHWPMIVFTRAIWPTVSWLPLVAALAALGPTWLSFRWIENPLRVDDRIVGWRAASLVAICLGASLSAALGLRFVATAEGKTDGARQLATALAHHADELRGCSGGPAIATALLDCAWTVERPKGTVFLLGDSNAGQFTEPAALAANQVGYDFVVATRSACPFVDLVVGVRHHDGVACRELVRAALVEIERRRPALVIIASSSSTYLNTDGITLRDPQSGEVARTSDAKARLWEAGARSVLAELEHARIPTLLIHTAPQLDGLALATCPFYRIVTDANACGMTTSRAQIEEQQGVAREAERRAVASVPNASAADFTDDLCSASACPSKRDADWLYRDFGHLSVPGAISLTPRFVRLISEHARHGLQP